MQNYRKKPVVIQAEVFQWGMEDGVIRWNQYIPKDASKYPESMRSKEFPGYLIRDEFDLEDRGFDRNQWHPYIETLEGRMRISEGDYIITGVKGERYPCKADIFEQTYELVEE